MLNITKLDKKRGTGAEDLDFLSFSQGQTDNEQLT